MNRSKDWLKQADLDLDAAIDSQGSSHHEWASFQGQQSAEKALKALLINMNIEAWGHSLINLFRRWRKTINEDNYDEQDLEKYFTYCQELDRHYIQPRYPNGFSAGHPAEYYNEETSKECIEYARAIIEFVKEEIKTTSSS